MSLTDTFCVEKARKADKLRFLKERGSPCKPSEKVDVMIEPEEAPFSRARIIILEEDNLVVIVEGKVEEIRQKRGGDLGDHWVNLRAVKWGGKATRTKITIRSENLFSFAQVVVYEDGRVVEEVGGETKIWGVGQEKPHCVVVLTKVGMSI